LPVKAISKSVLQVLLVFALKEKIALNIQMEKAHALQMHAQMLISAVDNQSDVLDQKWETVEDLEATA